MADKSPNRGMAGGNRAGLRHGTCNECPLTSILPLVRGLDEWLCCTAVATNGWNQHRNRSIKTLGQ